MRIWVNCCRLETTVEVRQSLMSVGQNGRVRITVDMPESVITHSTLCQYWVPFLPIRGTMGGFVFSAHQGNLDFW